MFNSLTWELIFKKNASQLLEVSGMKLINLICHLTVPFTLTLTRVAQCQCHLPALLALLQAGGPRGSFDPHPTSASSCCHLLLLIHSTVKRCGIMRVVGADSPVNAVQTRLSHLNAELGKDLH